MVRFLFLASIVFVATLNVATAAPLVIGKRYPLNSKAQRGTLVWQFIVFERSITGGVQINLEVYNRRAKSIGYFDEYRNIVDEKIQKNTISKFSMRSHSVNFSSDRYAEISFQVSKLEHLYYLPLRVEYKDGFEDYLVRLRLANGKLSIASRLLQHGKVVGKNTESEETSENQNANEQTKEAALTSPTEADKDTAIKKIDEELPETSVNDESNQKDDGLNSLPQLPSEGITPDEEKIEDLDPSLLAPLQQAPSEELSNMLDNEKDDPSYQDPSDIQFDLPPIDDKKEDETKSTEPTTEEDVDTENKTEN